MRRIPGLRFVDTFHADPGYIKALAQNVNDFWVKHGRPDRLLMSFHGLPQRTLDRGDPYHCLCLVTAPAARARNWVSIPDNGRSRSSPASAAPNG